MAAPSVNPSLAIRDMSQQCYCQTQPYRGHAVLVMERVDSKDQSRSFVVQIVDETQVIHSPLATVSSPRHAIAVARAWIDTEIETSLEFDPDLRELMGWIWGLEEA